MSGFSASSTPGEPVVTVEPEADATVAMSLAIETVAITKRVRRSIVRASRSTTTRNQAVTADLKHEHVVVERVAVGRVVEAIPPVRQEGDVTIVSVVEEEVVVTRRLILKEEVHLRRVSTTIPHAEVVSLRQQVVSVSRTPLDESA